MKKFAVAAALLSAAIATPAMAVDGEGRVEVHGGYVTGSGYDDVTLGVGAGYDFNLGSGVFAGPEIAGDKVLENHENVQFSAGGRAGVKIADAGKLYGLVGYTFGDLDDLYLGAGYEHKLSSNTFVKGEYRHQFDNWGDTDAFTVGVGLNF